MKIPIRIVVEVLGPALLGTILLLAWKWEEFVSISGITIAVFLVYLAYAYTFAIIPSIAYAFLIETWLKRGPTGRFRIPGLVLISTLFGAATGCAIMMATEAPVAGIGILVGLILGAVLSLGERSQNKKDMALKNS